MPKEKNTFPEVGFKLGNLVVIDTSKVDSRNRKVITYLCFCGNTHQLNIFEWIKKVERFNGIERCRFGKGKNSISSTHMLSYSKEYRAWVTIITKSRLRKNLTSTKPTANSVTIDPSWIGNFKKFLDDIGYAPSPRYRLCRLDRDSDYIKSNLAWLPIKRDQLVRKKYARSIN